MPFTRARHVLERLRTQRNARSLGSLAASVPAQDWSHIREVVATGVNDLDTLNRDEKQTWAAAFLILGARVFREVPDPPFRYQAIESELESHVHLTSVAYDALHAAARDFWSIEVLKSIDGRRLFLGTMVAQSGAAWPVIVTASQIVTARDLWSSIGDWPNHDLAQWLMHMRHDYRMSAHGRRILSKLESASAVANRLHAIGQIRRQLENNLDNVWDGLTSLGDPVTLLDAPGLDAAKILASSLSREKLVDSTTTQPRLLCLSNISGLELVVEVPSRLSLNEVPIGTDRARLSIRHQGERQSDYALYSIRDGVLHCTQTTLKPKLYSHEISVVLESRMGSVTTQTVFAELNINQTVTLFDWTSGERIDAPREGQRIIAISDQSLESTIATPCAIEGWHAVEFEMPAGPLELTRDDGSTLTIESQEARLELELFGDRIDGLTFARTPVFRNQPRLAIDTGELPCTWTLMHQGSSIAHGEVKVPILEFRHPTTGRYSIQIASEHKTRSLDWIVAPSNTRLVVDAESNPAMVRAEGPECRIFLPGAVAVKPNIVKLADDHTGRLKLKIEAPELNETPGTWRMIVAPRRVTWREAPDGDSIESPVFENLRGMGGLHIQGPPGERPRVRIGDLKWVREIPSNAETFFSFTSIPPAALNTSEVRIEISWDGLTYETLEHLKDPTLQRPHGSHEDNRLRLHGPSGLEDPRIGFVPAWQPWTPPVWAEVAEGSIVSKHESKYICELAEIRGPHICALFDARRRMTGCRLVQTPADPPDDPLERLLWEKPRLNDRRILEQLEHWTGADRRTRVPQLFKNLSQFGPGFFRIAQSACAAFGDLRLRAYLLDETMEWSCVFDQVSFSMLATRHDHLERLSDLEPEILARAIDHFEQDRLGLITAACRAWPSVIPQRASTLAAKQRSYKVDFARLDHDAIDLVRTQSRHQWNTETVENRPRLTGLIEARHYAIHFQNERRRLESAFGFETHRLPDDARGLPGQTSQLEMGVIERCEHIVEWRTNPGIRVDWSEIDLLFNHMPTLFDFWLNAITMSLP